MQGGRRTSGVMVMKGAVRVSSEVWVEERGWGGGEGGARAW